MFRLTRWNIANRSMIALAVISVFLFGLLVIPSLKQELLPSVQYPAVGIIASYPGASPSIVEQEITKPIEQSLLGGQGVQKVTSYSNEGSSLIIIFFDFGADVNTVSQQVSQQVNRVQPNLPAGVVPQVITANTSSQPIIQLAVASSQDEALLATDLKNTVVPALQGINGVSSVQVTGVRNPIVTVQLDAQKMQAMGVTITQVQMALQGSNVLLPAGEMTMNDQTLAVRVNSTVTSLQDIKDLVVGQRPSQAAPVKLSDVATVQQTLSPSTTLTRTNGQPSIGLAIYPAANGNTVTISQSVRNQLSSLEQKLGHSAHITIISDDAPPITSSIESLVREGLMGAVFAIIVILLFLLSIRSTLVTAISIPLSIMIALIGLKVEDYTLNIFTLAGLTIAIGRVVDDSIVVLENIYRHLRLGEPKEQAIPTAVREVGLAVVASTLTTVAVFLPLGFVSGIIAIFFRPFALVVTIALLASLLVALFVIPVLAYWFLKVPSGEAQKPQKERSSILERAYVPMVRWATTHRIMTVVTAFVLLVITFLMLSHLGTGFVGSLEQNSFSITQTLPTGTSLAKTSAAAQQVENVLANTSGVQHYQVTMGSDPNSGNVLGGANEATFTVITDSHADQSKIQQALQKSLNDLHDAGLIQLSRGSSAGNSSIDVEIQANDENSLEQANSQVLAALSHVQHTSNLSSNLAAAAPLVDIQVDRQKAIAHGLSPLEVGQELRTVYTGATVATVTLDGQEQNVALQLAGQPQSIASLQALLLPSPTGNVKLGDVANVVQTKGPAQITHLNGTRTATISVTPTIQNTGAVTQDIQRAVNALKLPAGVTAAVGGVAQQQSDAFGGLGLSLLAAILLVFLVMVATFRSLLYPLILLVSIPFAAIGSVFLLLVTGNPLDVPAFIGLLMLVGIVVTNAIVLLDRVLHHRAEGMSPQEAVIEGARHRVRPILMTAIATICALIPLALGLSGSSGFISSTLALTVIGGLTTSTFLTLLLVPTLYVMFSRKKQVQKQAVPVPQTQRPQNDILSVLDTRPTPEVVAYIQEEPKKD